MGKRKNGRGATGLCILNFSGNLELLVRLRGGAVHRVLGGLLGIAERLLALALHFLDRTFAFQALGPGGLANLLLGLADGFVGRTFNLVSGRTHKISPPTKGSRRNVEPTKKFPERLACRGGV